VICGGQSCDNLGFLVAVRFCIVVCMSLLAWLLFFACVLFLICSSHRQQICMAWREHIVLDKPERIISQPAADSCMPVLFYELAEVIRVDDFGLQTSRPKRAGL